MNDWNSKAEWRRRLKRNPVFRQMALVREATEELVKSNGAYTTIAVSGPPGVGKNHIINEIFDRHGVSPRPANPGSNVGLIEDFYEAKDGYLLFDEADRIFNAGCINTLKKAFDTEPKNRWLVNNIKGRRKAKDHLSGVPFRVRCKSVILTNKDINDPRQFSKAVREHLDAITSRVPVFSITFDTYAIWEYTVGFAIAEDMLKYPERHSLRTANLALEYLTKTMWMARDASPRRLKEIAQAIRAHPSNWKAILDLRLPRPELRGSGPIPEIPEIAPPASPVVTATPAPKPDPEPDQPAPTSPAPKR
jgi:hypothetical protein